MKKIIGWGAVIAFFAFTIIYFASNPDRIVARQKDEEYNRLMSVDLEYNYPSTPTEVVKLYCSIESLIYSYKFKGKKEGRLSELVKKQLELIDDRLIDFNGGEEKIILSTKEDSEKFLSGGFKIMNVQYQTSPVTMLDDDGSVLKYVNVIEYVSIGENAYKTYLLKRDKNKRWKILSYSNIEPFTIS